MLRDDKTFSSSINAEHIGQFMGDLILAMDGDEHRKYRNLVAKAFRASQLEQWDDTLVRPMINALLDTIAPLGRADLVARVTSQYPVQVICGIVGRAARGRRQFAQWAEQINTGPLDPEARAHGVARRWSTTSARSSRRGAPNPTGDFLSDLVHAEVDGEQLTDGKIYGFLRLLLPGRRGDDVPRDGQLPRSRCSSHPDALGGRSYADRVAHPRGDRGDAAVGDVGDDGEPRRRRPTPRSPGCPIAAGSPVGVLTGSANRDEARWDDAGRVAARAVRCSTTSRSAPARTSASACTSRGWSCGSGSTRSSTGLPNLRLDPDADLDEAIIEGYAFRGPRALPVLFDAVACTLRGRSRPGALRRATARGRRRGGTSRTRDPARRVLRRPFDHAAVAR